jgi:hypothetical protein
LREFTDEEGDALLAWARHVLYEMPDVLDVGDKVLNLIPAKMTLFQESLRYGIGTPAKQVPEGGHATLQIVVQTPLGEDPIEEREKAQALEDAKEVHRLGGARPGTPVKKAPPPLTQAMQKAMRAVPEVIADPIDPSLELEPVTDQDLPDDPALTIHEGDMP